MGIQFPPFIPTPGPVVTVVLPTVATSTNLVPADLNRLNGTIYNFTNRPIGVSFGAAAATLTPPSKVVPANGNIDIYENYTGAIQVIGTTGGAGNIQIDTVSNL